MCIPSFEEFIVIDPKYKKFAESEGAEKVYNYLKIPENIDKMVSANENGRPALYGVQSHIEANFSGLPDFDFMDGFVKQCVGSMIREILAPLGYRKNLQRDLPKNESLYFTSGMHYNFVKGSATCQLIRKLEIVKL